MKDNMIRGITADKSIRIFAVDATETVRDAVKLHDLSITNSVLLGRLICGALMMGFDLKSDSDVITLKVQGDGPSKGAIATAYRNGTVKGYVNEPSVELPLNKDFKRIDVKNAIGYGTLTVIKDLGVKRPYIGQIELISGEIAEDLTYYYVKSEQTPSAIGLGVLVDKDGSILRAGGFMVQLLPDTPDATITKLENAINRFPNLTDLLDMNYSIEEVIRNFLLKDFEIKITQQQEVSFKCDCSYEKFLGGIKLLKISELEEFIEKNENVVANCHFCNKSYSYEPELIKEIIKDIQERFNAINNSKEK